METRAVRMLPLYAHEEIAMTSLTDASFDSAYDGPAHVPAYGRDGITSGVVHLGVGAFFRAHHAYYTDLLLEKGLGRDYGIIGVGILPQDAAMRDALVPQRGRYTLLAKDTGLREARVVGSIQEYLLAPEDPQAVIDAIASPSTRIVTLTVTEGGYYFDPNTGAFMADHPDVAHDVDHPDAPRTHLGFIAAGLRARKASGIPAPTLLTCDNIEGNGHVFKAAMVDFARLQDADLAEWIEATVSFPNTMVDRITPRTTDADRAEIDSEWGIEDAWPVVTEEFVQWVIEDAFPMGRPPWDEVGVQLVDDVRPFELLKLRILNASHQILAYLGYLAGYTYVDEAMADERFVELLRRYMTREGSPTLEPVPGTDVAAYGEKIISRFANTEIKDTLARLCTESSTYVSTFVLPVVRDNLAADGEIDVLALQLAAWARYLEGADENGAPIEIIEKRYDSLHPLALAHREDPRAFFRGNDVLGELAENERLAEAFERWSRVLRDKGALGAIGELLATA